MLEEAGIPTVKTDNKLSVEVKTNDTENLVTVYNSNSIEEYASVMVILQEFTPKSDGERKPIVLSKLELQLVSNGTEPLDVIKFVLDAITKEGENSISTGRYRMTEEQITAYPDVAQYSGLPEWEILANVVKDLNYKNNTEYKAMLDNYDFTDRAKTLYENLLTS
ncbi:MAG: hypothetical protein HC798_03020 [Polaribacter sp.]|nr:hypothetical protein [Polaribacter sp.]